MRTWIVIGIVCVSATAALGGPAHAQDASGILNSEGGVNVEIVDAYAFRGPSAADGEPVWIVALSNTPFVDDRVDRYRDRRYVLETYFRNEWTTVAFLELEDDGALRGLSYSFGSGDECGFCRGEQAESKIVIVGGQIVGWLRWQEAGIAIDTTLDVTASTVEPGQPLPEDGGAPGAAYMAFHRSLRSLDEVSLRMAFSEAVRAAWNEAAEAGEGESYIQSWVEDHMAEVGKLEGWSRDDQALLLVEGSKGGREMRAEVLLVREDESWRVDDEMVRTDR